MRVETASSGVVEWYPTLAHAVAERCPQQLEWSIPGVEPGAKPIESQAARIQAFPSAVSVDHGTIVRRRLTPTSPVGSVVCYFIGGCPEINLGTAEEVGAEIAAEGANAPQEVA